MIVTRSLMCHVSLAGRLATHCKQMPIAANVLRLCDGRIENLIINRDVSAAIAKPLLAAGLSHNT